MRVARCGGSKVKAAPSSYVDPVMEEEFYDLLTKYVQDGNDTYDKSVHKLHVRKAKESSVGEGLEMVIYWSRPAAGVKVVQVT